MDTTAKIEKMDLDKLIEDTKSLATEKAILANKFKELKDYGDPKSSITSGAHNAEKDSEHYEQIAKLLEELKAYRELEEKGLLLRNPEDLEDTIVYFMQEFYDEWRSISQSSVDHFGGRADGIKQGQQIVHDTFKKYIGATSHMSKQAITKHFVADVGEHIWVITKPANFSLGEYAEIVLQHPQRTKIQSITMSKHGVLYHVKDRTYGNADFGRIVFIETEKEKAEARLAELKKPVRA